jgi:plasmid maintenance system antidote protein VapI
VKQREFVLLANLPQPKDAAEKTLRLCDSEQDAIAVSIAISGLHQAEIARRMGIAKSYLTMLKTGERVLTTRMASAFCSATGSNLVRQYRTLQSAFRIAQGRARECDRIAAIASYSQVAA